MPKKMENEVLFSGYAKLPTGITASELYKVIGLVVIVDIETGIVKGADCTLATELARKYAAERIVGYNLNDDIETLQEVFEKNYHGSAKKAIITSLRIIHDKYKTCVCETSSVKRPKLICSKKSS